MLPRIQICGRRALSSSASSTRLPPLAFTDTVIGRVSPSSSSPSAPPPSTTIVLAHATGFCRGVFNPFLASLSKLIAAKGESARVLALDFSGHGGSSSRGPFTDPSHWDAMCTRDILELLEQSGASTSSSSSSRLVGIGHSMGAAGLLFAELSRPGGGLFSSIVAFEPIMLPPEYMKARMKGDSPLAAGALRRRAVWPSEAAARAYFLSKPLYASFAPEALEGYLNGALVHSHSHASTHSPAAAASAAGSVVLACTPAFEAGMYRADHDGWQRLPLLTCPVTVVAGNPGETAASAFAAVLGTSPQLFRRVAERIPKGKYVEVPKTGHFLPLEAPEVTAKVAAEALGWC